MVRIDIEYLGDLRVAAVHAPSGARIVTDAPIDNQGKGESFSPTDLVGTAMGTCMLTIMGIAARKHALDLTGTTASVEKSMIADPRRRIAKLEVVIRVPRVFDAASQKLLEEAALTCPVHASLRPETQIPVRFEWPESRPT